MHKILLISLQAEKIIVFQLCCYAIFLPKNIYIFSEKGLTDSNRFVALFIITKSSEKVNDEENAVVIHKDNTKAYRRANSKAVLLGGVEAV